MEEVKSGKIITEFTEAQIEELNDATHQADMNLEQFENVKQLIEDITKKDRKQVIILYCQLNIRNIGYPFFH